MNVGPNESQAGRTPGSKTYSAAEQSTLTALAVPRQDEQTHNIPSDQAVGPKVGPATQQSQNLSDTVGLEKELEQLEKAKLGNQQLEILLWRKLSMLEHLLKFGAVGTTEELHHEVESSRASQDISLLAIELAIEQSRSSSGARIGDMLQEVYRSAKSQQWGVVAKNLAVASAALKVHCDLVANINASLEEERWGDAWQFAKKLEKIADFVPDYRDRLRVEESIEEFTKAIDSWTLVRKQRSPDSK